MAVINILNRKIKRYFCVGFRFNSDEPEEGLPIALLQL